MSKEFKYIPTAVNDFISVVDKERFVLCWESIEKTISLSSLTVVDDEIGLAIDASIDSPNLTTLTTAASGLSSTVDDYVGKSIIFIDGKNSITRPKSISAYNGSNIFTVDDLEYITASGDKFGVSTLDSVIYDNNIYVDSTITYGASGSEKVTAYDRDTKTFTVSGSASALTPAEDFNLVTAYYPRLYVSDDNGDTYDDGTNITYTVDSVSAPVVIDSSQLYNRFTADFSSLLNLDDVNFYNGAYITFITGENKGVSKQITSFDRNSYEFTTEYFEDTVSSSDIFSISIYSIPLTSKYEDYIFKIRLWNNDPANPIYSSDTVTFPSASTKVYLESLSNNYWNTEVNTNLYDIIQGVTKGGHARADNELQFQRLDFSIENARENKLYTNFGQNLLLEKNPAIPWNRYSKRVLDVAQAYRLGGTYESLYNIVRSFTHITPTVKFLSQDGWRLGNNRLGLGNVLTFTTVVSGDSSSPYDTFTTATSGASGDYTDDYMTFTDIPSGSTFDTSLLGKLIPITTFTPGTSATDAIFTIDEIDSPIPAGATVALFDSTATSFGTIPYSNLALLFGIRIFVYGPNLDTVDSSALNLQLSKTIPLHTRYFTLFESDFFGDSSLNSFGGTKVALDHDYSVNVLKPIKDELLEPSVNTDTIASEVQSVSVVTTTFAASGLTYTNNYYKDKYVTFLTGNNAGIRERVTDYVGGSNEFTTEAFPYVIQVGDTFTLEKIEYQTKYTTTVIDLELSEFFTAIYTTGWYARKVGEHIDESVYIDFSDDGVTFNTPRATYQNEDLNTLVTATIPSSGGTTTTFSASATTGLLESVDDYYKDGYIKFNSGTNIGEIKQITSYTSSTSTFVTEAFTNPVDEGDEIIILTTDLRRYCRMYLYHNNVYGDDSIEIESIVVKKL